MRGDTIEAKECPTCHSRPTRITVERVCTTTAPGNRTYTVVHGYCATPGCGRWHHAVTFAAFATTTTEPETP